MNKDLFYNERIKLKEEFNRKKQSIDADGLTDFLLKYQDFLSKYEEYIGSGWHTELDGIRVDIENAKNARTLRETHRFMSYAKNNLERDLSALLDIE
jgi:hypothetical protein